MMFVQDHDEAFFDNSQSSAWSSNLKDYNEASIYDCPTKTGKGNNNAPEYGYNAGLFGVALGDVQNPTVCPITADLATGTAGDNFAFTDFDTQLDARHNSGLVLTCVDGHVAYESFNGAGSTSKFASLLGCGYDPYDGINPVLNQPAQIDLANAAANNPTKSPTTYTLPAGAYPTATTPLPSVVMTYDVRLNTLPSYQATYVGFFVPNNASVIPNDGWYGGAIDVRCKALATGPNAEYRNDGGNPSSSIMDLYMPRKPNIGGTTTQIFTANTWYTVKSFLIQSGTSYKALSVFMEGSRLMGSTSETLSAATVNNWQDQNQVAVFTYSNTTFTGSARNISLKVLP
jgi:hypothetical protein